MSTTPQARAEDLIERLFAAHGGRVRVDAINSEVTAEVIRQQHSDPEMFMQFLKAGVSCLVNNYATRPISAAQARKLFRSIGMDVPEVH